jgi:hypothetical protein
MNILLNYLKVLKVKTTKYLVFYADGFSQFFGCIFVEKIITKASLKSLASYENPSSNPHQEACSGF